MIFLLLINILSQEIGIDLQQITTTIIEYNTQEELTNRYKELYNKEVNYIAFYSQKEDTIYIIKGIDEDLRAEILVHEYIHAIISKHFRCIYSAKIHEIIAESLVERLKSKYNLKHLLKEK